LKEQVKRMRKKVIPALISIIFFIVLTSCSKAADEVNLDNYPDIPVNDPAHIIEPEEPAKPEPIDASNISPFMEDIEYLEYMLENNFSLFDVAYWARGVDIPPIIENVKNDITTNPDMDADEFLDSLLRNFNLLNGIGHFGFLSPGDHQWITSGQSWWSKYNPAALDRLHQPNVVEFYEVRYDLPTERTEDRLLYVVDAFSDILIILNEDELAEDLINTRESGDTTKLRELIEQAERVLSDAPNVVTKILEEGRIAYLSVGSFWVQHDDYRRETRQISDFYDDIRNYDHLIIDLRRNSGGDPGYFTGPIMGPIIAQNVDVSGFAFFSQGDYTLELFPPEEIREIMTVRNFDPLLNLSLDSPMLPISEMLDEYDLSEINIADMERMDNVFAISTNVRATHIPPVNIGKVWFLTGPRMYSAAQISAWIAKESGFATLVGDITGGVYGGPRTIMTLPNSGIAFTMDMFYLTDEHGRPLEAGTLPHYFNRENMDALETTLAMINEEG